MTMVAARLRRANPQLLIFLTAVALMGISGGIFETTFNNYLNDTFRIGADVRGYLEFPRELPGFLCAVFVGLLFFLPETYIAGVAALALGCGMIGLGCWGHDWHAMLAFLTLWSTGAHLMMPIRSSIGMSLASGEKVGLRLGQVQGAGIFATIVGCGLVWFTMKHLGAKYALTFIIGGGSALVAAMVFFTMRLPGAHLQRHKFIFHRSYWLYYTLAFLFGARKQVFITFGPWVLVRIFGQPAYIFAQLWIASAILGVMFQPTLGKAIDRFGERRVLVADSVLVFLVCMGYGFSYLLPNKHAAGCSTPATWGINSCSGSKWRVIPI